MSIQKLLTHASAYSKIALAEGGDYMEKEEFVKRLTELRLSKDVSAREMSLSLGLSEGFINKIENGGSLPNMTNFLYICDYFGISPKEFFDFVLFSQWLFAYAPL